MGTAPTLLVVNRRHANAENMELAHRDDYQPGLNIPGFGMCMSMANPMVATATAAAQGVLTPQPCLPVTMPWENTSQFMHTSDGEIPVLTSSSMCRCGYNGTIFIDNPNCIVTVDG